MYNTASKHGDNWKLDISSMNDIMTNWVVKLNSETNGNSFKCKI